MNAENDDSEVDQIEKEKQRQEQDFFERLPPDVQAATLAKRREKELRGGAYQARLKERYLTSCVLGGVIAFALGLVGGTNFFYLFFITLTGSAAAFFTVKIRGGHLSGMLLFGGGTVAVMLISFIAGLLESPYMIFSWIFLVGAGGLIGFKAEQERTRSDSF